MTVTSHLVYLLEQKLSPLQKLLTPRGDERCTVELEHVQDHHSGKVFRAEINLFSGGKMFRAEAREEQIEQAIDVARNELKRELQHEHGKRLSLFKKGRQTIKAMLRLDE
jgi:ribosomal subunit interface protein